MLKKVTHGRVKMKFNVVNSSLDINQFNPIYKFFEHPISKEDTFPEFVRKKVVFRGTHIG